MTTNRPPGTAPELFRDGAATRPERIATGATWGEGPLWLPDEHAVIWSDIPGDRILRWSEADGVRVARTEVEFTNGRALTPDGRVVTCSHGRRAVEVSDGAGEPTTLVDRWDGHRLNSPNDVIVDRAGRIWFTDPPYGIVQPHEGHPGTPEYGGCWVFRLDPATGDLRPVVTDVEEPNGLALSPDESMLYVSDTSAALRTDGTGHRRIMAYDVLADGSCARGRMLAEMTDGLADGFRVDVEGRVWTSHGAGVSVIAPDGTWLATVPVPETVGNLCFGGPDGTDLFLAASTSLYRLRTTTTGATTSPAPAGAR